MGFSTGGGGADKKEEMIRFGSYNIRNGLNGSLESAMCGMAQVNIDLGILHETKITDIIYTRFLAGFCVVETDAPSRHRRASRFFFKSRNTFCGGASDAQPNCVQLQYDDERAPMACCWLLSHTA